MDRRLMTTHTLDIAEPHARGDGPLLGDHACLFPKPSPTHVGMDRRPRATLETALAEPHARGDGPVRLDGPLVGGTRAPRTWGWTVPLLVADLVVGPSPTHVGMDRHPIRRHERSPHRAPRTWGWTGEPSNTARSEEHTS